jgi:hypothetical protein
MQTYPIESSLIKELVYDATTKELTVRFKKYYVDELTYLGVPKETFTDFLFADSYGKFYLKLIKPRFQQKTDDMAEKKSVDKVIQLKVKVNLLKKEWFFIGKTGDVYADITILYHEEKDQYGCNGMIVQDVPSKVYKESPQTRGPILGNCATKVKKAEIDQEALPGAESGELVTDQNSQAFDDLPF